MYTLSNGSAATEPLNSETRELLRRSKQIRLSSECGWAIGIGYDEHGKILVKVHANTEKDILKAYDYDAYMKQRRLDLKNKKGNCDPYGFDEYDDDGYLMDLINP